MLRLQTAKPELWQVQSVSPSDQLMKQMTDVQLVGDPRKPNVQQETINQHSEHIDVDYQGFA